DEVPVLRAHSLRALLDSKPEAIELPSPPGPDDTATIVFTSGSTGLPKGIPYSHRQIILACDAISAHFPSVRGEARLVCWLPLSNLFQRILNLFAMSTGAQTFFVDKPDQIIRLLPEIRPTLFVGVPRFFEKLHAGIVAEIDRQPSPIRRLLHAAWKVGQRVAEARRAGRPPPAWCRALHPLSDRLLARVRALMGPELMFMASGSAPLPQWLMERFHGLGWLVLEAYGVSENVIPIAINTPEAYRFGSVGRPLPGIELRVAEDGELLVRGPGVFAGYLDGQVPDPVFDNDRFLHTGDYAHIDDDGYLWLLGRKSEVFKTSTGRRITPVPIEAELKKIDYVEHAIIAGRDRPYPVALLTIDPQHPLAGQIGESATLKRIGADAAAACQHFPDYQRPGAIIVSSQPFTILGGELTANLKVRRQPIEYRFAAQIEQSYQKAAEQHSANCPKDPVVIHAL
ncbi:MAG: long-chain fatty acid--CoA ligase, partial [Betaproteobacteria bacterium HGW-Betaproteobacteria-19]